MTQDPEIGRRAREAMDRALNSHARAEQVLLYNQMVIDDFVVERIATCAGHVGVFEAQQAYGTARLARLEHEDRIVAMGDPYDAYYDVPAGDR